MRFNFRILVSKRFGSEYKLQNRILKSIVCTCRHMHEMETLQRRMEELQRQYMKDKETYRLQLISSLLAARKTQVPLHSYHPLQKNLDSCIPREGIARPHSQKNECSNWDISFSGNICFEFSVLCFTIHYNMPTVLFIC